MWGYHDGFGWWMVFGGVWMALFWGGIIWFVVWAVNRSNAPAGSAQGNAETPLEIAMKRLARGELSKEQFEELKNSLR